VGDRFTGGRPGSAFLTDHGGSLKERTYGQILWLSAFGTNSVGKEKLNLTGVGQKGHSGERFAKKKKEKRGGDLMNIKHKPPRKRVLQQPKETLLGGLAAGR